jgi:hypothetical protein
MVATIALFILLTFSTFSSAMATGIAPQVEVCSKKNSSKCVSGSVKSYNFGQKVRLPGGTWVDCAGDCKYKLRTKTVDFWYDQMLRN